MRYVLACLILCFGVALLDANPPARVRVQQVNPFLATQFGQIVVPTYGAAYNGQIDPADFKALVQAIQELNATLKGMATPAEQVPAPAKTDSSLVEGLAVLQNRCAKCHDKSVSATKGGPNKFTLLDGAKLAPLTTDQALDCVLRIDDGSMPMNANPLSDVETAKVFKMFRQMKANTVKGKK